MNRFVYQKMSKIEQEHWWFKSRRKILKKVISKFYDIPENKFYNKILEVGSGTGGNIDMLKEFGSLDLIETSDYAIQLTERMHKIKPMKITLPGDPLPNKKYNLIVLFDVLEHIEKDIETLDKLSDLLEPEGKMIITVPAYNFLWSQHDTDHEHKRRYTLSSLKEKLPADLKPIYTTYFNSLLFLPIAATRILKLDKSYNSLKIGKMNSTFEKIFSFESKLLPGIKFPVGVSCLAVLEKTL